MNYFKYTDSNKRYYTLDYFYKNKFKSKVFKVSLNAGFTCPNIDGTVGYGGCIYCSASGSGDFAGNPNDDLITQFNEVKNIISKKWPNSLYIGYFQAHTNTYAPLSVLKEKYELILNQPNVIGLSIATRCDAISDEVLDYLEELSKRTYLTIELGLQTIHEETSKLINRCHSLKDFEDMVLKLKKRNINIVVHIINGLPYETPEMMVETVKYLNKLHIDGIKIHMLNIVKNTKLDIMYKKEHFKMLSKKEYVDIVCNQIENLKEDIVIHRLTGDAKFDDLIEPAWITKKLTVLNDIDKELNKRRTYQGFNLSILNRAKELMSRNLKDKDLAIDMTVGNGNDSLFIAKIINNGHLFGFDIQESAINNTKNLLDSNNITNYTLFNKSHDLVLEELNDYKNKISLIVFNLGYLPNGNKKITTNYKTTIKAIKNSLPLLNKKGHIVITVYPGHDEGLKESIELDGFLKTLDCKITYYHNTDNKEAPYTIDIKKC